MEFEVSLPKPERGSTARHLARGGLDAARDQLFARGGSRSTADARAGKWLGRRQVE
jgi:hypothetical protein